MQLENKQEHREADRQADRQMSFCTQNPESIIF